MDEHVMIWEFPDKASAQTALLLVNAALALHLQQDGYAVAVDRVIGKNAETGNDVLGSETPILWDTPRPSPEGTYFFLEPGFYTDPLPPTAIRREQPLSWLSGA